MARATTTDSPQTAQVISLNPNEQFFRYFQREVSDLQDRMTRVESTTSLGGERADAIDHCLSAISRLSNEVQDASSYIPAYDQRTYGEAIKALNSKLQQIQRISAPKPKFSFKSGSSLFTAKKNASAISISDAAEPTKQRQKQLVTGPQTDRSDGSSYVNTPASLMTPASEKNEDDGGDLNKYESQEDQPLDSDELAPGAASEARIARVRQPSFSQSSAVTISRCENVHIVLPTAASRAISSGTLSNLTRCVIDMSQPTTQGEPFATLTLKNIASSLVICGHVSGAAHLTKIENSVFVVASRQFRMHDSSNCDVYLFSKSRPIIENCSKIRFAPLPEAYATNANRNVDNKWSSVDDFKWLKNEQSPNWSVLPEGERLLEKTWKDIVPGGPDLSVEDVLDAVGIAK